MVPVARKNLLAEKTRFFVAVGGVAFAVFLIIVIQGVYMAVRKNFTAVMADTPADVWVTQDGAFDMFHSRSSLPEELEGAVAQVPGVTSVHRVLARQMAFQAPSGETRSRFMAFHPGDGAMAGDESPGLNLAPGQVAMSDIASRQSGAGVGDRITLGARELLVVATTGERTGIRGTSFLNYADAQAIFDEPGRANYLIVSVADPTQAAMVARDIEVQVSGVSAFTQQQFIDSSLEEMSSFEPIIAVIMVIGFVVGATVISLTIYTATVEKAREFGVMKALGASSLQLYRIVVSQSFVVGLLGFATGVPLAVAASKLIERFVPEFSTLFQWQAIVGVLVAVLLMSFLAAYLPVRRIARIDPAAVFRA
ncbi:MAG: FtsX-like permease family protein [Chloroflexota bacterium]|nr:FtsX-like permease family protein [Chloroflexota bacterium]